MREIKFRAWDKDNKKMLEVKSIHFMESDPCIVVNPMEFISLEHVVLMQYTGLKDKNGIEIYNGDIVKGWRNEIYTVAFVEKRGGYYPFAKGDGCGCCDDEVEYDSTECEVLGNCYENPELLEGNQ